MNSFKLFVMMAILLIQTTYARDYIIYSISQNISMGFENEVIKKNFYLNMGNNQGLRNGTIVDVFRSISRIDPYASKKRYNYSVKIGELKVLHSEEQSSIASLNKLNINKGDPLFDIENLMIGDKVKVKVE